MYPGQKDWVDPAELKSVPGTLPNTFQQSLQAKIKELYQHLLDPKVPAEAKEEIKLQIQRNKSALKHSKEESDSSQSLAKFVALLKRDCSQSIMAYKKTGAVLYRGIRNSNYGEFKAKTRDNRRPMDTGEKSHNILDKMLKASGFETTRSNSIFTSSSTAQANMYGDLYVIFPVNGFKFLWNEKYKDLYSDFYENEGGDKLLAAYDMGLDANEFIDQRSTASAIMTDAFREADKLIDQYERGNEGKIPREVTDIIWSIREGFNMKSQDLLLNLKDVDAAVADLKYVFEQLQTLRESNPSFADDIMPKKNAELLIRFVALIQNATPPSNEQINHVVRDVLQFRDTGFVAAIQSKHEVCIHGEYYAFHHMVATRIMKLLEI